MLNVDSTEKKSIIKTLIRYASLILLVALLMPTIPALGAPPPIAQSFYGSVTLDGAPAPDGTNVTATMNGRPFSTTTSSGEYSLIIQTIEGDQPGATITFTVAGYAAGSATFNPGGVTKRDLSASSPPPQQTLTMAKSGEGSTSPSIGSHSYNQGSKVNISASPASGWRFTHWIGDVANNNSASTTVTMSTDKTVTAVFEKIPTYTLTIAINGEGTVSPAAGSYTHQQNTTVTLSATPADGWRFVNWTGGVTDPNSVTTTVIMTGDKTVTANFAPRDSFNLTINIEGEGTTSPRAGTRTYSRNTEVEVTATPATGYKFYRWIGDVRDPNSATTTVIMDDDKEITACFVAIPVYTLTIEVNGKGTTEPAPGVYEYHEGTEVEITAVPADGHRFREWTGDVADPGSATTTITITSDKTVTANFVEGPPPPPEFTNIEVLLNTRSEAVITWTSDLPAVGKVIYKASGGTQKETPLSTGFSTSHAVVLKNLEPGTTYYYSILIIDEYNNEVISPENTFTTTYTEADFVITGWECVIEIAGEGREVTLNVTVANSGDVPGGYELVLKVNGATRANQTLNLKPNNKETATFTILLDTAGSYNLDVNGFTLAFEIPEPPEEPVIPDPEPFSFADWLKDNWPVILGVVIGIILLLVVIYLILRHYYYIVKFVRR